MNEEIEKIDSEKDSKSDKNNKDQKHHYQGDPLFHTIDKTPYRGYGFTEVSNVQYTIS